MHRSCRSWMVALLVVTLMAAGHSFAATERAKIGLSAWPAGLSGTQRIDSDAGQGSTADLEGTLGIEGETAPDFHADLKVFGPMRIVGSFYSTSSGGRETLSQDLIFNGTTYSASENIESEMDMTVGRVLFAFNPVNFDRISLGLGVGAELLDLSSEVRSDVSGTEVEDITAPVPVVGVNLTLRPIKKFALFVEAAGMSVGVGDVDAKVMDGMIRAEYYFLPWMALTGGYRRFDVDVSEDRYGAVDLKQDGAQIGLVFKI